jgi:hypothetical protein
MTKIVINIVGDDVEIGEAVTVLLLAVEEMRGQGFALTEYEVGPERQSITLTGRSKL